MPRTVAAPVPFTTAEHWHYMAEFIRAEMAVGGPDPHIATLGEMMGGADWEERVWRAGCYAVGYNVPTAEILWKIWPWPEILEKEGAFRQWVRMNWDGIGLRRERRAVRTPRKYADCLLSYAHWMMEPKDWWGNATFAQAWGQLTHIWGMGRYVLLKLNEVFCRYCDGKFWQDDIRAMGGRSPREGLALLWPGEASWLLSEVDDALTQARVEELATATRERLGLDVSYFVLQVVLCEYKKCFLGRQYPGRTHDTELRYLREAQEYWHHGSGMLVARAAVFPAEALGELQGWNGARETLEPTLPWYRYTWSDLKHDYLLTLDPAEPAFR